MPTLGHFVLHSSAVPPLTAGDYVLEGDQQVAGGATAPYEGHLRITSPRYRLPADQLLSTFPPANSEGAFEAKLPQVVLRRRTLPWERAVDPFDRGVPWLALVLIAEGEGQLSAEVPVAQCVTPGVVLTGGNDVATGVYLGVSQTVVDKVFPTKADLALLAHVREVDIDDTELAMGDDDGFMAVIMANRLPQFDRANCAPVRYLACLINLEGQLDVLPPPSQPFTSVFQGNLIVQDLRASQVTFGQQADIQAMGTGLVQANAPLVTQVTRRTDARTAAPVAAAPSALTAPTQSARPASGASSAKASQWTYTAQQVESAVAAAPTDAARVARDVMSRDWRVGIDFAVLEKTFRFPVLAYWSFACTGAGSFETLLQGLDVGLLGTLPADPAAAARPECQPVNAGSAPPPPPPSRPDPEGTETGHIGLDYLSRRGESLRAWYRGPCTPQPIERDEPGTTPTLAHTSDQLRRVVPDGREDLSLASAFEIGRLLALSQPSIVSGLMRWRQEAFGAARAAELAALALKDVTTAPPAAGIADLGHLLGRELVLKAAADPTRVLASSRPLADAGRPLKYVTGDLDEVIAMGFGFDAAVVRKRADTVGVLAALGEQAVPLAKGGGFDKAAQTSLKATLNDTVATITADTLKTTPRPVSIAAPIRGRRAAPKAGKDDTIERDALDDLLDARTTRTERP